MDIFYKELSYEQISQQPAFEFLSLLGEVGGFLGLLLGASVLTVCELLDYLSLLFIRKWKGKPKVDPKPVDPDATHLNEIEHVMNIAHYFNAFYLNQRKQSELDRAQSII